MIDASQYRPDANDVLAVLAESQRTGVPVRGVKLEQLERGDAGGGSNGNVR